MKPLFLSILLGVSLLSARPAQCQSAPSSNVQSIGGPAASAIPTEVMLFRSRPYVAASTTAQHFQDNLTLKQNQEQLPLFLTVRNGSEGKPGFNWFRLNIAGYLMASEQDLGKNKAAVLDVSGKMQPGGGQVLIEAAGEPGATLIWSLTTVPVYLTSAEPSSPIRGGTIVLTGKNFSSNEDEDSVLIDGTPAKILSASETSITARVPSSAALGKAKVKVLVDSIESTPVEVSIAQRPAPVLLGTNFWMAPPGAVLRIVGQNFSANLSDNKVFFGNVPAQVIGGDSNMLQVTIPNWSYGPQQLNIPLYVLSDGVRSANAVPFDIGPKYLSSTLPPIPGGSYSDSGSQASSSASSEASSVSGP